MEKMMKHDLLVEWVDGSSSMAVRIDGHAFAGVAGVQVSKGRVQVSFYRSSEWSELLRTLFPEIECIVLEHVEKENHIYSQLSALGRVE
jgi:hypothetical protein